MVSAPGAAEHEGDRDGKPGFTRGSAWASSPRPAAVRSDDRLLRLPGDSRVVMNKAASAFVAIAGILAASFLPARGQSTLARWSPLAPMPTARQEISVSVVDGKVIVIGGYDASGQSTATVEVYDPSVDKWQVL